MKYGHFDDNALEYVITRPDTPLPWINYLGTKDYFGIISNTAGGFSFYKDARLRRLTRYRHNNVPLDTGGRYIYIRDNGSPQADFWSPTWQPTRSTLEAYECHHGLGYSRIISVRNKIKAEIKYFIPCNADLEIWELTLTNQRSTAADLSIFSAIEFCLWDAQDDATNFQRNYSIGEVEVENGVIYHKSEYRERRNHFAYFACSEPLTGFDTQREDFLGVYRGWDSPFVVEKGVSSNSIAHGWQPIGSQHVKLTLKPRESRKVFFILGFHENSKNSKFDPSNSQTINKQAVLPVIQKYLQPSVVEQAFSELHDFWRGMLDKFQVETEDVHTNRMVNIWNAYQMMVTFNFSRSTSYFESGIGRGIGFRDSNQDMLGFMHLDPARARQRILDLASTQLTSGEVYHQYQPMTKQGNAEIGGNFNDDPLWLVLASSAYLKETNDWSILDEMVPFDQQPGSEAPLYEHLQRSIRYTLDRLGPHGLPLIGRADWNDCLNLNCFSDTSGQSFQTVSSKDGKVAESIFIAGLFIIAAGEMESIAHRLGRITEADGFHAALSSMASTIETSGWDGEWFRRAYDDLGNPVGSVQCSEGKIYIEPQGICVMAGIGLGNGKAQLALDSVNKNLATEHGIMLLSPAYQHYYLNLGEISSYPPGYKENGSVFCHTNPWIMIAETRVGHGDRAFDYFLRINPSRREEISDLHRCEPYVYAQMIAGTEAFKPGEAKNSWLTGTATWNYVAITQWILGIRPEYEGLRIEPVLPETWKGFKAQRTFRGVRYEIDVQRRGPGGKVQILVDGNPVSGSLIPLPQNQTTKVEVKVFIG